MSLRVLHLTTVASPVAGAEVTSVLLARELPALGIDLEVCTLSPEGQVHERLSALGLPSSSLDAGAPRTWAPGLLRLQRRVAALRPHVIHCQLFHASLLGALTSIAARRPLVITRQYILAGNRFRGRGAHALDAWGARRAARVVAISTEAKRFLETSYGLAPARVEVIHNAADVARFADRPRRDVAEQPDDGPVRLAYVASLLAYKGHRHLLDALRLVKARGERVHVLLVGDGPERAALERQAREQDLSDCVSFLGWRQDVPELLADVHAYVHPTLEEAFGIAIAEAMAAGLPVIATRVGGIPDVVVEGETGFLVPAADPEALAARLSELCARPALRAAMATAGKRRALASFSARTMAERYAEVFRQVAGPGAS